MKALVTGGGGFLGSAIARQLLKRGDTVRSFSRGTYPKLEAIGVDCQQGSLCEADAVLAAAEDCDIIFHVAAKAGIWGSYREFFDANVAGTENVLAACRTLGIPRLVYTSSPSVVFHGSDLQGADESIPYPDHFDSHYSKTKMLAERMVVAANGPALATVALRPHLIWGPGDNHLIPRIVARAKSGQLRLIGDGKNLIDSIYIDNAAMAHVAAADRLAPDSPVAGQVYFLSQGEPMACGELINRILAAAGLAPVTRSVPANVAYAIGGMLEAFYRLTGRTSEPRMTRFLARQLSTAHWFNITAAQRDLGYQPKVSIDEGLRRLHDWFLQAKQPIQAAGTKVSGPHRNPGETTQSVGARNGIHG